MRNELELIEKIENYLKNNLSRPETADFEQEMAKSPSLQEQVDLLRELLRGVERIRWKEKVDRAGKRFKRRRNLRNWGSAAFTIIVLAALVLYYKGRNLGHQNSYEGMILPELNESGSRQWADADKNLPAQTFLLDPSRDTVVETRAGITLSVPANAFLDAEGNTVTGRIDLIVKEALDAASIIKGGLSSRSGDQLLESGGMFFMDARQDGQVLKINPGNGIYTEVPADGVKQGMKLFSGRRLADGTIDWVAPHSLEHGLVPVDIHLLDFYPPHYLDSLAKWGYNIHDKKFTDSLYYSFARLFGDLKAEPSIHPVEGKEKTDSSGSDTVSSQDNQIRVQHRNPLCFLNPAKIKAIWNDEFQNTLLSTREFGERMPWIHRSGNQAVMDLYVDNLDKDLSSIDSMAARLAVSDTGSFIVRDQFLAFWSRHNGKVKTGSKQFLKLKAYYEMKTKAYTEAVTKTQAEFWARQDELDHDGILKRSKHRIDSMESIDKIFNEEFKLNLNNALLQLGYDTILPYRAPAKNVYAATLINTGWCNIDRVVYQSATTRTTLDYTDPLTGKKAVIKYLPVSFTVENVSGYDRIYLYLLPDKLSSFMRLSGSNGTWSERLDELMKYDLVCIAYKNEQAFYYSLENIRSKDYPTFALTKIDSAEIDRKLNARGNTSQGADLKRENVFIRFDIRDQKRQDRDRALQDLTDKILYVIIPCSTMIHGL